jgi:hypothetical protein
MRYQVRVDNAGQRGVYRWRIVDSELEQTIERGEERYSTVTRAQSAGEKVAKRLTAPRGQE